MPVKQLYRFDGVEVDPSQGCLRLSDGKELYPRQKSFQVLLHLLEQRHRLVTKNELIERAWEGTAVSDDALVQLIKELRENLGDDYRDPKFIKTVPKGGYLFIAPVEEVTFELPGAIQLDQHSAIEIEYEEEIITDDDAKKQLPASPRGFRSSRVLVAVAVGVLFLGGLLIAYLMTARSSRGALAEVTLPTVAGKRPLAVMYFANQSHNAELDWLKEGLTDMLITDLSRSGKLMVLSRQQLHVLFERTGRKPGEVGLEDALDLARRSHAEVLVTGSFAELDGKIRIEAQLHSARTGQLIASESLVTDHPNQILTNIDLLSLKLASHLGDAPAGGKPGLSDVMTNNLEAYRYYSLALEKSQGLHAREGIALLEKAVALDPQFAMAHARIGYTYAVTWGLAEKGKPHLEKAFKLSDRLTEKDKLHITAWYAIANLDYPGAAKVFRQMIVQYPAEVEAYWRLGRLLLGEEQYDEAIAVLKQGLLVDAEAQDVYNALGVTYRDLRRHEEAIANSQRYAQLAPNEPNAHDSLALAYQGAGRNEEALEEYKRALVLNADFEVAVLHLGNLYFQMGHYSDAIRQYQRYIQLAQSDFDRAWGHGRIAWVHFRKGELDQAAAAARDEMKFEKSYFGNSLLIALERKDTAAINRLKEQLNTTAPFSERGLRPAQRSVLFLRGQLTFKEGRREEAIKDFQKVITQRPMIWDIDSFEDCLGNAYLEMGRLDDAIAEFERILRINPNYPLVHFHLGQAYQRKGQRTQAIQAYEHFLRTWTDADKDIPEVEEAKGELNGLLRA